MAWLAAALVCGITLDRFAFSDSHQSIAAWTVIAATCVLGIFSLRFLDTTRRRSLCICSSLITATLVASMGGLWQRASEHRFTNASINRWLSLSPQPVVVKGSLLTTVSVGPNPLANRFANSRSSSTPLHRSRLIIRLDSIRGTNKFHPCSGRVALNVDGDLSALRPGCRLQAYGWLTPLMPPSNPGQPDLRGHYRSLGLHAQINAKDTNAVKVISPSQQIIQPLAARISRNGRLALSSTCSDNTQGLATALILGQREGINESFRDKLLATGTAHLLSVSGMHLAILVAAIASILSLFGVSFTTRFWVILAVSVMYVLVTGCRPPVIRAAILVSILLLAMTFRQRSQPLNTLALAGLILLLYEPTLLFSTGVHLSFLAVATLMIAGVSHTPNSPSVKHAMDREAAFDRLLNKSLPKWRRVANRAWRTLAQLAWFSLLVSVICTPLTWYHFHLISLISAATNVFIWFGLIVALPAGVLTVLLHPVAAPLAWLTGKICHLSLLYISEVVHQAADLSGSHYWLPSPPAHWVILFYVVLALSLLLRTRHAFWYRCLWIAAWSAIALGLAVHKTEIPKGSLEATFLDVSHGTCVIIRDDAGSVWLYDCGRLGNANGSSRDIDTALWSQGIHAIDGVFLSHADADHYNALPGLCKRFTIGCLITPPGMLQEQGEALGPIQQAIAKHRIPVYEVSSQSDNNTPFFRLHDQASLPLILHPPPERVAGSDNANSMVLQWNHGPTALLLPGDLEDTGVGPVTANPRPPYGGVIMAPHHGSLNPSCETVYAWAQPLHTVISAGDRANRPETLSKLAPLGGLVHLTANDGAIRVRIASDGKVEVRHWKTEPW
ncbi:ComEC family competence protein [Stieleria bergensis]|uniref:ComEC family competence protein n=2 Tax=Stieleria bergensis TaxID=2528025 RepID=A0A517T356_9BACT|nr:ComEC family competence protein [Planctomycetes bacterium SV_7m_r]